ncbi:MULTISPECIES: MerR family transcriptional regulator [unclassified Breznakia]|uniref:MerR family transcriptional regulator n=1 Tax=unclassified Breznakia TaxID=2623764 RepID=UPI002473733E|nr:MULTISPECIES: MerR family transcriptional regulator [unclassified Breznakia]MDH6367421.1 DNA-binding transcriptional MerR regulator [Breznakia sp. PH1-1]MDH6403953.1 DNA-binding transcriptional MerR regulator [Breznakia sp. PF1-11]MDH6411662.1 DNA-binding transcriptional MerR regulator [Breznakia sp. PFB1-11]MDH6414588.1 DNA-binding transcriptional MerR regulator [Breznakia sp. PFB1-14]MDH6416013.1 DNA-binding transcriptional MerR regulator [Breznakia sp. PFB1-4]
MLKIGDFSKFTKISIHMLRHYDEIDLLKPIKIDEDSGYRYYSEEQIPFANRIQLLKLMGFSLPNIKQMLQNYSNEDELQKYFDMQLSDKQDEMKKLKSQVRLLEKAIVSLNERKNPLNYSILVKELPKRLVISYRGIISDYNQEGILWNALNEQTAGRNIKYKNPSFDVAIIHSTDTSELIDVEVQKVIETNVKSIDNVICKEIPATKVAVVAYQGDYEQLETIYEEMAKWLSENEYELNGEIMNVYHISPKITNNQNEFLTEVCFPIKAV